MLSLDFLFGILLTTKWTNTQYLSHGVSQAICNAQQKFLDTRNLVEPIKQRPNGDDITLPEKCSWFKKQDKCRSSPTGGIFICVFHLIFFFNYIAYEILSYDEYE